MVVGVNGNVSSAGFNHRRHIEGNEGDTWVVYV